MTDDSVMAYKDIVTNTAVAKQLYNREEGFLYNAIVPAEELPQTNLFAPNAKNQPIS
jgi:hypothetical protein